MSDSQARLHIVEPGAGRATVQIVGDVDASNIEAIATQVDDIADRSNEVTIDLTGVTYIDSHGVRALQALADRSARGHFAFHLAVRPTDTVYRLLVITGLDKFALPISPPVN